MVKYIFDEIMYEGHIVHDLCRLLEKEYLNFYMKNGHGGYAWITVDLTPVGEYNSSILGLLLSKLSEILMEFELAAGNALETLLYN